MIFAERVIFCEGMMDLTACCRLHLPSCLHYWLGTCCSAWHGRTAPIRPRQASRLSARQHRRALLGRLRPRLSSLKAANSLNQRTAPALRGSYFSALIGGLRIAVTSGRTHRSRAKAFFPATVRCAAVMKTPTDDGHCPRRLGWRKAAQFLRPVDKPVRFSRISRVIFHRHRPRQLPLFAGRRCA